MVKDVIVDTDTIALFPSQNVLMTFDFKWLVITGKYYLLYRKHLGNEDYQILSADKYKKMGEDENYRGFYFSKHKEYSPFFNKQCQELIDISKKINAPVFCINNISRGQNKLNESDFHICLDGDIPILANLGVASLIKPEQIYQDIAYFIANTMNDSPDTAPPVQVADKDRIVQHGFDFKQSFRHRTK